MCAHVLKRFNREIRNEAPTCVSIRHRLPLHAVGTYCDFPTEEQKKKNKKRTTPLKTKSPGSLFLIPNLSRGPLFLLNCLQICSGTAPSYGTLIRFTSSGTLIHTVGVRTTLILTLTLTTFQSVNLFLYWNKVLREWSSD
jgi:hypothetical protein